ncbi:phytoene desaturase family protein [Thermoactinomyces mirandus]|uniref:NAD(P)/FAD-dependent oxidoreductase n=1 Tax=Thermoactinomyces mirandus TaxID=2756294 RepID=A0A7W1XR36_9BACL|nr:NAD(P)/FAD-dependent oxidoreductase [Thermoactinomyces mirandus]MBA4601694.1 NAD(P)/FAD-dependent oxidoreductase [Thermoactinomyces mirandus]
MKKGIVIGGGVAGLAAAIRLAAYGYEIHLMEKQASLGGRCQSFQLGRYFFDGEFMPILMPEVFDRVFWEAGQVLDPELRFIPLPVNSRHFFYNKTVIDLSADPDYMMEQLSVFSPEDQAGFFDYLSEVGRMYEVIEEYVVDKPNHCWTDFFRNRKLWTYLSAHPFETLDSFHRRYFRDNRLLAMMNRYALYMGSSPYQAPAALAIFSYLEMVHGISYVEGGHQRLTGALERLACQTGVTIHTSCEVEEILLKEDRVVGVRANGEKLEADFVISNLDVKRTQETLLARKTGQETLSSSGFLWLIGVKCLFPQLLHHNYFYPDDTARQYIDIFEQQVWPESPLIHVGNSSLSEPDRAPEGASNLSVMVHVPAGQAENMETYRERLLFLLEKVWGLKGLEENIETEQMMGPAEFEEMTGAEGGAFNGRAFRGFRSFIRPPMRDKKVNRLYYTGSTTYPGHGGISTSALSGLHVARIIREDHEHMLAIEAKRAEKEAKKRARHHERENGS